MLERRSITSVLTSEHASIQASKQRPVKDPSWSHQRLNPQERQANIRKL